jgi:glycosyltransferase involved in cell wall biosynthesis
MNTAAAGIRPIVVIPVFDHGHAIEAVVSAVRAQALPCLLVDDGSGSECAAVLDGLVDKAAQVQLVRRAANGGKGAAVRTGLDVAEAAGYTHAIQIDADGQHTIADLPAFLAAAAAAPDAVVCGLPVFDASIPRHRFAFRYLTHVLVWLNTLSLDIRDSMCGFRVYPIAIMQRMCREEPPGSRMEFDIEVLVRLHWRGVPMVWIPTAVHYPADGVSHFLMFLDNALISRLHARLFLGMLVRLPLLLLRRMGLSHAA